MDKRAKVGAEVFLVDIFHKHPCNLVIEKAYIIGINKRKGIINVVRDREWRWYQSVIREDPAKKKNKHGEFFYADTLYQVPDLNGVWYRLFFTEEEAIKDPGIIEWAKQKDEYSKYCNAISKFCEEATNEELAEVFKRIGEIKARNLLCE